MSIPATWAVARRVLWQIRRDPRTIALLLIVPVVLLTLLKYVTQDKPVTFVYAASDEERNSAGALKEFLELRKK